MGFTETLRLLVEADTKGAVSSVENLGKATENAANRSEKSLDRWGNRMQSVGTGMMMFGGVALAGLKQAGDAASDLNEVASKSSTVFGSAADEVDKFASNAADIGLSKTAALEAASGFGNLFDQLGFANDASADMSISLSQLAADFASFHNADITEVIEAQTAAFRGEYDSLQRFVPTINAAAVQQQAMAETGKDNADALTDAEKAAATYTLMVEGAGAATGDFSRTSDSAANKQRQLSANFENLKAGIGQGVLPAMTALLDVTNDAVSGFSEMNAVTDGTLGKVATFGAVGLVAVGGVTTLVGKVIVMRENFKTAATAAGNLGSKLYDMRGGVAAAVAGIGALMAAGEGFDHLFPVATANLSKLERDLLDFGQSGRVGGEAASVLGEDLGDLADAMHRVGEPSNAERISDVMDHITPGVDTSQRSLKEARQTIDDVDKALASLANRDPEAAAAAFERITESLKSQGVTTAEARKLLDDYDSTLADLDTAEATSGTEDLGGAMDDQSSSTEDAEQALKDYQDTLQATFDPITAMSDAIDSNAEAQSTLRNRQLEAIAAQDAYNDAVNNHGESSKAAREAAVELMDAQSSLTDAQRSARDAVIDLDGAAANLRFEMEQNGLTATAARERFINMAVQMGYTRAEAGRLAGQFGFATTEAQRLGQQNPRPSVGVTGLATADARIQYLMERLNLIPDAITTVVNVVTRNLPGGGFFGLNSATGGVVPQYLAQGGYGPRGTDTIPAWLTPGEMVLNEGQQARLWQIANGRGSGGGGTTIVHVHGSVLSERELYRKINEGKRRGKVNA